MMSKLARKGSNDLLARGRGPKLPHRGDGLTQPAGHDVLKIGQVCRMMQREAVGGDPAADVNTDGSHFLFVCPNAGKAFDVAGFNSEFSQRVDDCLLDGANKTNHVALPFSQIENGVTDDLSRAVIRNVAAAICGMKCNSGAAQYVFAG